MKDNLPDTSVLSEGLITDVNELRRTVEQIVTTASVVDIHTHVFPPNLAPCAFQASTICSTITI